MSQLHSDTIDGMKTRSSSTGDKHATEPAGTATLQRWSVTAIQALLGLPFNDLVHRAQLVHRQHHDANAVQLSTLISVKTGGCPEDCGYCPQAARYHTNVEAQDVLQLDEVVESAAAAKAQGATRFCMGAAWRGPKQRDIEKMVEMVGAVKALGLETCATLGMLKAGQAEQLREAGLDYYNHNLDTSPEFYGEIITTRGYQDRLDTLEKVRNAGINVCCGGIVGMGESRHARAGLIAQLANLDPYPESVPINHLVQVEGTPLHGTEALDPFDLRTGGFSTLALIAANPGCSQTELARAVGMDKSAVVAIIAPYTARLIMM